MKVNLNVWIEVERNAFGKMKIFLVVNSEQKEETFKLKFLLKIVFKG